MATDLIRYDLRLQEALREVFRKVLTDVAARGLPGEHHFLITFRTTAPGVRISERTREAHPHEMTIVLQHQFWDLSVSETGFSVGLSFKNVPEKLVIPFSAVTGFFDPSVSFGAEFTVDDGAGEAKPSSVTSSGPLALAPVADGKLRPTRGSGSEPIEIDAPGKPALKPAPAAKESPKEAAKENTPSKLPVRPPAQDSSKDEDGAKPNVVSIDAFRKKT